MSAKSIAVKLLSRREHSAFELKQKLRQREFDDAEIAQVIEDLQQGGWQSDDRFAEAYIRMRRQKGFGPMRIAMELNERGIDEALAAQYLNAEDADWDQVLQQQYRKKYSDTAVHDYNEKARRIRFLQYRGFSLDAIYRLFD